MTLKQFLEHYISGYLLKDLEEMADIEKKPHGGVAFPMIAAIMAGMELLGYFLSTGVENFNAFHGRDYFRNYWNNYLVKVNPDYAELGELFYNLLRHGIAHTFLTKTGVGVTKDGRAISVNVQDKLLLIDALTLYRDFKESYEQNVLPIVADPTTVEFQAMTSRMHSMLAVYESDRERHFSDYAKSSPQLNLNKEGTKSLQTFYRQIHGETPEGSGTSPTVSGILTIDDLSI